ncbi:MAG: cellulase family glycosylhydrolase, partial [Victivallales bacterium]|nr:cellulase family glycosylhydrolase [Victivallales bacterium]
FPLWDDFQPIYELPSCRNIPLAVGMRHDWNMTPDRNPEMVDPRQLEKFDQVVELAGKHNLKLIVALLTAWMSGVLFNPGWKGGRNLFANPFMLKYQILYCRAFARRYAGRPEILAWEYGNEQNCVDHCDSPETAWVWLHALAAELKLNDPETPVGSGMHGLRHIPTSQHPWGIADSADALDILTTHPYPSFTPGCFLESPTDLRASLHATIQSRYASDLGQRPVLCEETGTLGNSNLSETLSAAFLRMRLYSLFANGIAGCLWWCYSDFQCADELPYRDFQMENDGLGLTRTDGRAKPVAVEMSRFRTVTERFGGHLPELRREAAILASDLQEDWLSIYNCYVLCVQAGIAPRIVRPGYEDLKAYKLLLAPSFYGFRPISVPAWHAVLDAVNGGSTLYVSGEGISLTEFDRVFGISGMEKLKMKNPHDSVRFDGGFECDIFAEYRNRFNEFVSKPIAWYSDGTPAMLKHRYGAGNTYFLSMPLEKSLALSPFVNQDSSAWKIYAELCVTCGLKPVVDLPDPQCERYWNESSPGKGWLTLINHRRKTVEATLKSDSKICRAEITAGEAKVEKLCVCLPPLQAAILEIELGV